MKRIVAYFRTHKHRLATVALIFGFFVDIITFRNLNLTYALILLSAHLFIVAFSILILSIPFETRDSFFSRIRLWLPVAQQYSMGNLLSAFLILYSASGSLAASWPFLALVAVAAIGNETFKLEKYRLPFQTTLFFLNLILFFALLWPILFSSISTATFLASITIAAIVFAVFRRTLRLVARDSFIENRARINALAFTVFALVVVLYFTNLIPPIPLALKDVAFYHSVTRSGDSYIVHDEPRALLERYFSFSGTTLHLAAGAPAYVYTAVFAPAQLSTQVVHRWQRWDETRRVWITRNTVHFPIVGGREGGYRGYSLTESPAAGRWRVSAETTSGKVIGRAYLTIVRVPDAPAKHRAQIE